MITLQLEEDYLLNLKDKLIVEEYDKWIYFKDKRLCLIFSHSYLIFSLKMISGNYNLDLKKVKFIGKHIFPLYFPDLNSEYINTY